MKHLDSFDQVRDLTRQLVKIPSVNSAPGQETTIARHIHSFYAALPYFKLHPGQLNIHATKDDFIERHSVLAMVRGTKGASNRAVVLLSHIDTVEIEDYGAIRDWACDPDALPEKLMELDLSPEVIEDIRSGEFMFGRGALDMKSGAAAHMYLMQYFSQHPEELDGVLVALHACDEEANCHGIITGLDHLYDLKVREELDYAACINADYSTNYNPGDNRRYIYYGCIGKILPCFYALGKETHVGQAFAGFDPNLVLSEITRELSLNMDFADVDLGEVTIPPISLRFADTKEIYTVQTAIASLASFNLFTHKMYPMEAMEKCRALAERAMDTTIERLAAQYQRYCDMSSIDYTPLPWRTRVRTWGEFYNELKARHGEAFEQDIADYAQELHESGTISDMRQFSCRVIDRAWKWSADKAPVVILFLGSVFHTHCALRREDQKSANLLDAVEAAVDAVRPTTGRDIATRMFYPYIADVSFIAAPKKDVVPELRQLMPSWGTHYTYDMEASLRVDMPVCNIGTFGRDGHMFTERVDMRHTFDNVPNITYQALLRLLG